MLGALRITKVGAGRAGGGESKVEWSEWSEADVRHAMALARLVGVGVYKVGAVNALRLEAGKLQKRVETTRQQLQLRQEWSDELRLAADSRLAALSKLIGALVGAAAATSARALQRFVHEHVRALFGVEVAVLWLPQRSDTRQFSLACVDQHDREATVDVHERSTRLCAQAACAAGVVHVRSSAVAPAAEAEREFVRILAGSELHNAVGAALLDERGVVIGVLQLVNRVDGKDFNRQDRALLEVCRAALALVCNMQSAGKDLIGKADADAWRQTVQMFTAHAAPNTPRPLDPQVPKRCRSFPARTARSRNTQCAACRTQHIATCRIPNPTTRRGCELKSHACVAACCACCMLHVLIVFMLHVHDVRLS
jgi:hypothetical protein